MVVLCFGYKWLIHIYIIVKLYTFYIYIYINLVLSVVKCWCVHWRPLSFGKSQCYALCSCVTAPAVSFLLLCLCCMALLWKIKIENRSISSLLAQYAAMKAVYWLGNRQRNKLEKDTQDVHRVQEETLLKRLRKHSDTVYGKLYDFGSIKGDWFRSVYSNNCKKYSFLFISKRVFNFRFDTHFISI